MPRDDVKGDGGPVTMATVAARAGVSRQTVSNAINTPELLRPETLARVNATIRELGYRPHRAARSLRTRSSRLIGYAVRPVAAAAPTPVLDRFLHALTESLDDAGYRVLLFPSPGGEEETGTYAELLREDTVDAFVLTNTVVGDRRQSWLHERGVPFVAFGRAWGTRDAGDWVDVDGAHGTTAAVDHLVARGHRHIAFLGWPEGSGVGDDRARGWREALERHGLTPEGLRARADGSIEAATDAAHRLLDDTPATAVVAASDSLAMGCYRALDVRGEPPARLAVVGFDDAPFAPLLRPSLTTLRQPLEFLGRECVRLLLQRIGEPDAPDRHALVAPELVVRDSSPAPPTD
ncbi:LacI family DNA-binding transcriptional regulator [Streptomyces sp. DSM 42041]|uniref:LacI family DNA-binding transcriptional regulator n=1 Tax=Streptomyces hazeniae TaxID=3075538 RepID=A0ABU2NPF2_9ACTN|nr:LacI family DNA-binding transcriptional regulator [Streptomyces sp. DSM 42041]MDT0378655.1 LacI family DNA-binding transcriptional regulator [Streptomyces sp. DSM 42041]